MKIKSKDKVEKPNVEQVSATVDDIDKDSDKNSVIREQILVKI